MSPSDASANDATLASVACNDVGIIQRTPKVPMLDGTHLNWLIERYIESCRARLDHKITVDGYEYQLLWFMRWWEDNGPPRDWLLTADDLMRFEKYLRSAISEATKKKLAYWTRATIIKRLKEMFHWALSAGYVERDYAKWIPAAIGAPPKRKVAAIPSLRRLLEAAALSREPVRDRAILALLMGMGVRRAELSRIDIEQLVIEADGSGHVPVVGKRTKANPNGERDVAWDKATGEILLAYLRAQGRNEGPLFLGQQGKRLGGFGIYTVVKRAIATAALERQITGPHDLRRAFATHYRRTRKGQASADLLQLQLGHTDMNQTNEYTLLDIDDIRADIVSPLALFAEFPED